MFKLSQDRTKALVVVHGWAGMVFGLLLYAVVFTGTVAVFAEEIGHWSIGTVRHEPPMAVALRDAEATPLQDALDHLAPLAPAEHREEVGIGPSARNNLQVFFHTHRANADGQVEDVGTEFEVAPASGRLLDTRHGTAAELFRGDPSRVLSRFLVDVHTELHLPRPWGLILTGILGLAMMAAAVSGVLMHRHLLKDIFTIRRGGNRVLALKDMHTVAGSWGLPFAFVLAFTGSFFSFAGSVGLPVMAMVGFGGDQQAMLTALVGSPTEEDPRPVAGAALDDMVRDARWRSGVVPTFATIERFGRADASVSLVLSPAEGALERRTFVYDGESGAFVREKPLIGQRPSLGSSLLGLVGPLHFGDFMGVFSKAVWLALGFAMCYVTVTGMRMWLERRPDGVWRRMAWVVGTVAYGLPVAVAGSAVGFLASFGVAAPTFWTPAGFLLGSAAAILCAAHAGKFEVLRRRLLLMTGVLCLALPPLRMAAGGIGWLDALADSGGDGGQVVVVAVDLMLLCGAGVALRLAAKRGAAKTRETSLGANPATALP